MHGCYIRNRVNGRTVVLTLKLQPQGKDYPETVLTIHVTVPHHYPNVLSWLTINYFNKINYFEVLVYFILGFGIIESAPDFECSSVFS